MPFALSDIELTSPAFAAHDLIPARHTGEGKDTSPELNWAHLPEETQSLAVICHDPDAPLVSPGGTYGFVHWVLYNLPADLTGLAEGSTQGTAGKNDFGNTGYGGPMPPAGHGDHHYYYWLLALNAQPELPEGLSLWQLLGRIEPHIIGMNRLIGRYRRD
ncbi:MAG: YbhB/YbcL family Raf kinase inhibitor-like protein [Saccharospirillum sp.]